MDGLDGPELTHAPAIPDLLAGGLDGAGRDHSGDVLAQAAKDRDDACWHGRGSVRCCDVCSTNRQDARGPSRASRRHKTFTPKVLCTIFVAFGSSVFKCKTG